MHVIITGAGGFIGQALATALLLRGDVTKLVLTDVVEPSRPAQADDSKEEVHCIKADLTKSEKCWSLFTSDVDMVFLLHGIMSGAAEENLELGLKVNIDATRTILDILRIVKPNTRVVYTSTCAIYGPSDGVPVTEKVTLPRPGSSYGAAKLISETLLIDFSRRGVLDGRIVRLPTVIVRPGKPTGAASSFCSGIFREPLAGKSSYLPIARNLDIWVCSARTVIKNLIHAAEFPKELLEKEGATRTINLPGTTVSVEDMLKALEVVGGEKVRSLVEERRDDKIEAIVYDWNPYFDTKFASELGFHEDGTLERTIREYIEDYGEKV